MARNKRGVELEVYNSVKVSPSTNTAKIGVQLLPTALVTHLHEVLHTLQKHAVHLRVLNRRR